MSPVAESTTQAVLADAERATRELARRRLSWYWGKAFPNLEQGAWQHDLCGVLERFLEAVERRESPRLIIEAPPQHGKSLTVSRAFQAWLMGRHPDWPLILASYADSLASGHGRWVRNTLETPWHAQVFPAPGCRLADDSAAIGQFATVAGGQLLCRGIGGGTTGQPARIFTIDDPFADRQQADSIVTRQNVWDWYSSVAGTRLAPGGGVLLMNTRWHLDDLVGRVLAQEHERPGGDQWQVVTYPALAEAGDRLHRKEGDALHPERYSREELHRKRATMVPRDFLALYQQRPVSDAGGYFQKAWFRSYTTTPLVGEVAIACDFAYRTKEENDYTCALPFGMNQADDTVILPGAFMERISTGQSVERLLDLAEETGAQTLVASRDAMQSIGDFLRKRMEERGVDLTIHDMPERVDIQARARSLQGRMQQGRIIWPAGDLLEMLIKPQYLSFPAAKHDDSVSAGAMMMWLLNECTAYRPSKPKEWENPDKKRWDEHSARKKRENPSKVPSLFGDD